MILEGVAHRFGDNINTDYIIAAQHKAASTDLAEMALHAFEDIDPEFVERVQPGDVVVGGQNFGCGSSREAAVSVLLELGVAAVLAPSFARIYFRNAINLGMPVVECDTSAILGGHRIELRLGSGVVLNHSTGDELTISPLPTIMQAVLTEGGIKAYLKKHGDLVIP